MRTLRFRVELCGLTRWKGNLMLNRFVMLVARVVALPAHAVVTIDWVTVGDSGNACDT